MHLEHIGAGDPSGQEIHSHRIIPNRAVDGIIASSFG